MSEHGANIRWRADGDFSAGRYSRAHEIRFDGGAVVKGSSSPSVVPLPYSDPAGVDPEEALIASASACHMLWFLNLAQRAGLNVAAYEDDAVGSVGRDGAGRTAVTRISLRPRIAFAGEPPDDILVKRLHEQAHEACFIANSLKTEIVIEDPTIAA